MHTRITTTDGNLVATMQGVDVFLAARRTVTVPLAHVVGVEETGNLAEQGRRGWKRMGGYWPGWFRNGGFQEGRTVAFWNVSHLRRDRAVTITLRDEKFARLVLAVDEPQGAIATIRASLDGQPTPAHRA